MAGGVPWFSPMLASSGPVAAPASEWAFEPKLDGWRVLVYLDGDLTVRTRNGHNVTASVPELAPMVNALEGRSVVLDGELVARQGRPFDFYGLAPRLSAHAPAAVARRRARMPVTFAAFDVLYLDGETVQACPTSSAGHCSKLEADRPGMVHGVVRRRRRTRAHGRVRAAGTRGPRGQAARLDLPAGRTHKGLGEGEVPGLAHCPRAASTERGSQVQREVAKRQVGRGAPFRNAPWH